MRKRNGKSFFFLWALFLWISGVHNWGSVTTGTCWLTCNFAARGSTLNYESVGSGLGLEQICNALTWVTTNQIRCFPFLQKQLWNRYRTTTSISPPSNELVWEDIIHLLTLLLGIKPNRNGGTLGTVWQQEGSFISLSVDWYLWRMQSTNLISFILAHNDWLAVLCWMAIINTLSYIQYSIKMYFSKYQSKRSWDISFTKQVYKLMNRMCSCNDSWLCLYYHLYQVHKQNTKRLQAKEKNCAKVTLAAQWPINQLMS